MNISDSEVASKAIALMREKASMYNTQIKREDYFPFGLLSYSQMIHIKSLRLQSVATLTNNGKEINFESAEDTLLDLINYSIMAYKFLESQKENDNS